MGGGGFRSFEIAILPTILRRDLSYGVVKRKCRTAPTARGWRARQRPATAAGDEGEAQREGVRDEGGAGGNNLESSSSTLTAKVASTERQTTYSWWTQNVRASGGTASDISQALRSTASRCQRCRNGAVPFWTVTCGLVTTIIWRGEGREGEPFWAV